MFVYEDEQGFAKGTKELFFSLTRAHWTDDVIVQSLSAPTSCSLIDRQLMELVLPSYRAYKKSTSKLFVKVGVRPGGHSVHALEKIAKGTVVAEYVGEWLPSASRPSSYRFGPIDALYYRNVSGLIEDGFPNVAAFYLYNVDEVPLRVIFVSLEEISAGTMITVNYGMNHSVKTSYHSEYRLSAMREFFTKNSLEKVVKRMKDLRSRSPKELGWKRTIELENLTAKLRYLFHTPGALLHLQVKEFFHFYDQADFRYFFAGFSFDPSAREKEVRRYLELIRGVQSIQHIPRVTQNLVDSEDGATKFDQAKPIAKEGPVPSQAKIAARSKFGDAGTRNNQILNHERYTDLLEKLRHRIFFTAYLEPVLQGEDPVAVSEEALLWNSAFDYLEAGDRPSLELTLYGAKKQELLLSACIIFAKEIASPLLTWLQTLHDPILPLRPTG